MAKANQAQEPSMEEILASIRRIISDDTDGSAKAAPAPVAKAAPAKPEPKPEPEPVSEHMSEDDLDKLFAQADDTPDPFDVAVVDEPDEEVIELSDPVAVEEPLDLVEGQLPDEADVAFMDPAPKPAEPEDLDDLAFAMIEEPAVDDFEIEEEVPPPPPPKPKAARPAPPPIDAFEDDAEPEEPLISHAAGASVHAAFGSLTHTILSQNAKTLDDLVKEMLRPMLKAWLDENLPSIVERLVRAEIERVSRGR